MTPAARRLTLFAKGNVDVRDSLHLHRVNGEVLWNGINEVVRARLPGTTVRVRHETFTRSDALLLADGRVPGDVEARAGLLGAYPPPSQFGRAVFEARADATILSILPDVANEMLRHRRDGYLLYAGDAPAWPDADRRWLRADFEPLARLDAGASMANFERLVARLRAGSDAPILVFNVSSVIPGDTVHDHVGQEDSLATRIRRFNLGLVELSQRTGVCVVDVDTVVARHGADRCKIDALHLNATGCRLVAEEVVRILDELLCLSNAPA